MNEFYDNEQMTQRRMAIRLYKELMCLILDREWLEGIAERGCEIASKMPALHCVMLIV